MRRYNFSSVHIVIHRSPFRILFIFYTSWNDDIKTGQSVACCLGSMAIVAVSTTIRHREISDYDVLYFVHLPLTGLYFLIYRMIISTSSRRSLNTMWKQIKEIKIQPLANFEARPSRSLILCIIYDHFIKLADRSTLSFFLSFQNTSFAHESINYISYCQQDAKIRKGSLEIR